MAARSERGGRRGSTRCGGRRGSTRCGGRLGSASRQTSTSTSSCPVQWRRELLRLGHPRGPMAARATTSRTSVRSAAYYHTRRSQWAQAPDGAACGKGRPVCQCRRGRLRSMDVRYGLQCLKRFIWLLILLIRLPLRRPRRPPEAALRRQHIGIGDEWTIPLEALQGGEAREDV